MKIRPLGAGDLEAIRSLCAEALPRDRYADQLPAILTRLDHVAFVAEAHQGVVGCCIGSRSRHGVTEDGHLDLITVNAEHRRNGIGSALLEHLEVEMAATGCKTLKIEGNAPSYAWAGVDVHYTSGLCFIERMGFVRDRCAVNMEVNLTTAFDTHERRNDLLTEGIAFRWADSSDEAALEELAGRWSARWAPQLMLALARPGSGVCLAEKDGSQIAFCAFGVNRIHEIGPLWVDQEMRRQGVASVLLKMCCSAQQSLGLMQAELQWAGPLAYFSDVLEAAVNRVFLLYNKRLTHGPQATGDR
jgi:mycothiol synthase